MCPTLCDPMDCSLPGASLHGILQATALEWGAISFSRGSSQPRDRTRVFHIPGRRFNLWATRMASWSHTQKYVYIPPERSRVFIRSWRYLKCDKIKHVFDQTGGQGEWSLALCVLLWFKVLPGIFMSVSALKLPLRHNAVVHVVPPS